MVEQRLSRRVLRALQRRARTPGRHPARVFGALPARPRAQRSRIAVSGRARLSRRPRRQHVSDQRPGAPRRRVSRLLHRLHRLRRSVRRFRSGRAPRHHQEPVRRLRRRPRRSQARRLRGPRHARRRALCRPARNRARASTKGDFMLLEYAGDAKLYVPLTRMDLVEKYRGGGRRRAAARPARRRHLDRAQIPRQSQNARHGR